MTHAEPRMDEPDADVPASSSGVFGKVGRDGRVVSGSCRLCQYSLVGLEATGSCPECGSSIASSLTVEYTSRRYVRTLARGMSWLRWAMVGTIVSLSGMVAVLPYGRDVFIVFVWLFMLFQAVGLVGAWLLGTPESSVLSIGGGVLRPLAVAELVLWSVVFLLPAITSLVLLVRMARTVWTLARLRWVAERLRDFETASDVHACLVMLVLSPFMLCIPIIPAWFMSLSLLIKLDQKLRALAETMPPDAPGPVGGP